MGHADARTTKKVGKVVSEPEACSNRLHRPTRLLQSTPPRPVHDQDATHSYVPLLLALPPHAGARRGAWHAECLDTDLLLCRDVNAAETHRHRMI